MAKFTIEAGTIVPPLPHTERGFGMHLGGTLQKVPRFAYCSGILVVQRELGEGNAVFSICAEHGYKVNVAKYHPNGEWICSGDDDGNVLVWAHKSQVIKNTIKVGRKCLDCSWSHDGQRIMAVGAGKDDKAKVFPWNSNNKLGEISGAQKGFLACDFKPNRPFRVVASGEDYGVYCYVGPPFKFETYDKTHKNYVNSVRYNHDGTFYVSVGSDKQILVFDGKTGKKVREVVDKDNGHKGSIYEVAFSPDGKHFMTASADKTCKVWDFETGAVVHTFTFADKPTVKEMQVTCYWIGEHMMSISLSGHINFLKMGEERPIKILTGHRKAPSDMSVDRINSYVYTCDNDSRVVRTECKSGDSEDFYGDPHSGSQIRCIEVNADSTAFYTCAVDDTFARHDIANNDKRLLSDKVVKLEGAPRAMSVGHKDNNLCVVSTHKEKALVYNGVELVKTIELGFEPCASAISPDDGELAVGSKDNKIHLFSLADGKETAVIANNFIRGEVTSLSYSPDGAFLASADRNRHIWIWDRSKGADIGASPVNEKTSFQFHQAMVSSIEWSQDSVQLVSAAHDNSIYVWSNAREGKNEYTYIANAFNAAIRRVSYIDDTRIAAVGSDCTIRFFNLVPK